MGDIMFTASTGLAVLLCVVPGIFHVQTRNYGAIFMTIWIILSNFIIFVNSLLWPDPINLEDKAEIWCLISSPIYVATHFGLLASITCMIYTLYSYVAYPVILTETVKRRGAIRDFIISIVMPLIFMGLFYLVQKRKYSIRPVLGCFSPAQINWVFIIINNIWPPIISLIGCYYSGMTAYAIIKKRLEIQSLLRHNESGLSSSKFYRLVFFCITFLIFALPAALLNFFSNILDGIEPYDMYKNRLYYNDIEKFPGETNGVTFVDYAKPLAGFFVFIFFGTGQDAMTAYGKWLKLLKLDKVFGFCIISRYLSRKDDETSTSYSGTLRSFQSNSTSYNSNNTNEKQPQLPKKSFRKSETFNTKHILPPPNVLISKEKKISFKNILFLNGHRTPSEQAAFDLTSGLKIRIDGIDTQTVIDEVDEDIHLLIPTHHQKGIHETLQVENDNDDDFGTNRYVENYESDDLTDSSTLENSVSLKEITQIQSLSFGDIGSVSHIDHLLSVYPEHYQNLPTINVTPSSPQFQENTPLTQNNIKHPT
ncbi:11427_t:CDS:2 [Funneliformis mosseae]|uniref:11427_t:CDS:1 n=1 Tax=Funneliformis mosseae TaxID=27381 RepID=A0A9N8YZY8_FUNMO|nr:11427_t:CDS:2 [Funneliformis mosseae]